MPDGTATTQKRYYQLGGTTIGVQTRGTAALTAPVWDYILGDVRSSTTLTARKGTATTGQQWYSPYGAVRGTPSVTATTRGYISQHHDTTTGLSYLNNRFYDPATGVFVRVDPLVTTTMSRTCTGREADIAVGPEWVGYVLERLLRRWWPAEYRFTALMGAATRTDADGAEIVGMLIAAGADPCPTAPVEGELSLFDGRFDNLTALEIARQVGNADSEARLAMVSSTC